ncbi:MAG: phosphopyruvate hydratase [Planctomycetes bacterium]|nr:phosphopyruvate hydratase [Planctomycetota bacterium]
MDTIETLHAMEILDSRGRPTVRATCRLASGATGTASVPSGASTGKAEALELRDGETGRYNGLGCRKAVANVNGEIRSVVSGQGFETQEGLDAALCELDGTPNKARLGANAVLAVSIAYARAVAAHRVVPLYKHLAHIRRVPPDTLPRPTINLFSGGKHAGGQVSIQDVLIVPTSVVSIEEALAMASEVYRRAAERCAKRYDMRLLRADEGGMAPPFKNTEEMLLEAVESILVAGLEPGRHVSLAIDVASSHFHNVGTYTLDGEKLSANGMIERIAKWVEQHPIVSVEDGLAENDWDHWPRLRDAIGGKALVLGDDLLCTNPERIRKAADKRAADALLLKVNQIGTLSEAAEAMRLAREANWKVTVSARSGETEDDWLADLAVGWGGDQIKIGSITQSDRLSKYNRLLEIEDETSLPLVWWPNR